jgi:hypothetical protein
MTPKLIASTIIPLLLATTAGAQSDSTAPAMMGSNWNEATTQAFFADDGAMSLRSEAEIQTSWAALSAEEQATVRADCMAVSDDTTSNSGGAMATGTGQTNSSTFGTATTGTESPATTGGTTDLNSGASATGTVPSDPSTFGSANTGTDSTGAAASGTASGAADTGTTESGTGQMNSSTFGTATTGSGFDQVTQESWTELCSIVGDL